jgi:hypothetical protein
MPPRGVGDELGSWNASSDLECLFHRIQPAIDPDAQLADWLGLDMAQPIANLIRG